MTKTCDCGEEVSDRFVKVYGDNDGNLRRCIYCTERGVLRGGGGAIEDIEGRETKESLAFETHTP